MTEMLHPYRLPALFQPERLGFFACCLFVASLWGCTADPQQGSTGSKPNEAEQDGTRGQQMAQEQRQDPMAWVQVEEGQCIPSDSITVELSDGIPRRFPVVSAYAEPAITITSMQGATVATRKGSGYTLYVADYQLDPKDLGRNPEPDQAKLEFTFITQDHSPLGPGLYARQKDNLAVGPNLFYAGKAYPMKNNFTGGVFVSVVDDTRFCGQIQLRSKFEVVIQGHFSAQVVDAPHSD